MASNRDTHEDNMSEYFFASNLPEWKRDLWLDISEAAQAKSVFHKDDYDETGELNMHLPKFTDLYRWLVGRSVEEQFKTLKADWRHVDKARWELNFLVCSNDQLAAAHEADSSGNRTRVHRKRTDMFVEGLQPTVKDWVIVRSEGIPAHEDLPKTASGRRKHCSVM